MGIIAMLLFCRRPGSAPRFHIPLWVVLSCHAAIGLGTLLGGWRIVKTMGMKITKLRPVDGFCAETGGAVTLFLATHWASPSPPRTPSPAPSWAWARTSGLSAVRWGVARSIVWAWILTIPGAALIGSAFYFLFRLISRSPL